MKLGKYLKDRISIIIIYTVTTLLIILLLLVAKTIKEIIIFIAVLLIINGILIITIDYLKKRNFYNELEANLEKLDKKYLIQELVKKPNLYEEEIFYNTLYEINKSMIEDIKNYKNSINDFKEYIEMWIHEVKLPISSLVLINHNTSGQNKKYAVQIKKLDNYIDQILYYVRSENAEKDFLIKETNLNKIVTNVLVKNKDDLLENNINITVNINKINVLTDAKWLEFIIGQIINNSIKYKKNKDSNIIIEASDNEKNITLSIEDNGIGIIKSDIPRLFEKSFTGENGREKNKSTGMGLYIVKKLCDKMGHKIEVLSEKNKYTKVNITFEKNDYYKMK